MIIVASTDTPQKLPSAATIGMFDGVHAGHLFLLSFLKREASMRGLATTVVTFSRHPQQVLHPEHGLKLLMTTQAKLDALSQTGIDCVVMLDFTKELSLLSARDFLRLLHDKHGITMLVAGYDHRFGHDQSCTFSDYVAYGKETGVEIVRAPEMPGMQHISSSAIRRALLDGNMAKANTMLTRPYALEGTVVAGFRNGRRIGFPTANLDMSGSPLLIPADGVYAVRVALPDGSTHGGMLNIGTPSVEKESSRTVEVHLLDFSGDLYGQHLSVLILEHVRNERKMGSLDELKAQLLVDKMQIINILKHHTT